MIAFIAQSIMNKIIFGAIISAVLGGGFWLYKRNIYNDGYKAAKEEMAKEITDLKTRASKQAEELQLTFEEKNNSVEQDAGQDSPKTKLEKLFDDVSRGR